MSATFFIVTRNSPSNGSSSLFRTRKQNPCSSPGWPHAVVSPINSTSRIGSSTPPTGEEGSRQTCWSAVWAICIPSAKVTVDVTTTWQTRGGPAGTGMSIGISVNPSSMGKGPKLNGPASGGGSQSSVAVIDTVAGNAGGQLPN